MPHSTEAAKSLRTPTLRVVATNGAGAAVTAPLPSEAGSWRLEGLLGEGALARVFQARPVGTSANQPAAYALKMLRPQWEQREEAVALLRREAKIGRTIVHPHVVPVLAAQLREPPYFVVMPRLVGQTLAARLETEPQLSLPTALWIARQAAEGLAAIHAHGYHHGDVKPANIFVSPNGHVTLLDLGFARRQDEADSAVDRIVMGTINYLAPELLTSTLRAGGCSDIYSLGVVLYEMLAGRPPLVADNLAELLDLHQERGAPNLRAARPDAPVVLSHFLRSMLAKDPLRRPQTMLEVVNALVALEIETLAERSRSA
jgi:serine/threonine protein kinase